MPEQLRSGNIFMPGFGRRGEKTVVINGSRAGGKRISADRVEKTFSDCSDFVRREIVTGGGVRASVVFIDGLCALLTVSDTVLRPLTDKERFSSAKTERETLRLCTSGAVYGGAARACADFDELIAYVLDGHCAVIFDGIGEAAVFEARNPEKRGVEYPREEKVVKGSKDAFVENIRTNTMLVRRKIKDARLKILGTKVGKDCPAHAVLVYIEGFTDPALVREAGERLARIENEAVLTPAEITENLVDFPRSLFPQMLETERCDRFCMNVLEGRVGIIVDGLPLGFLVPGTFSQFFKVAEDHAEHYAVGSVLTLLRYAAFALSLVLPALYVAVSMYHQEMLPTKLIRSIIDSKQYVPFTTAVEIIAMLLAFELLQEAGLRLPSPVGQTVSIIGALIVGQSAVEAKVVSPVVVIVVALSGIAGYAMPDLDMGAAIRVWRFVLCLCSLFAGMFGLMMALVLLIHRLCSMSSFGVAYMAPFSEGNAKLILRAVLRYPMTVKRAADPLLKRRGRR